MAGSAVPRSCRQERRVLIRAHLAVIRAWLMPDERRRSDPANFPKLTCVRHGRSSSRGAFRGLSRLGLVEDR
ncbi:hypothetical protein GQ602_001879 [Ophiocordyceps camponoti-floridani]|uniref:Uncharacterized protein n=1 Tax=Ophiocordyceps camponoti-floridani TaxID=2030778 RepID=A0A8H4VES6_9HYPO|nr:hypothetical protein GQ602_001879 [Ophiocordyceps camponoti-floridani]